MATQLVARVDELFAVDAEARDAGMDHARVMYCVGNAPVGCSM